MKYTCTLIAVRNMERAKQFYLGILGLEVVADFGGKCYFDRRYSTTDCFFLERFYS